MAISCLSRRSFAVGVAASASTRVKSVVALPYQSETDVWTGSVLLDQDGRSFGLSDLERPLTILKLWAGWCPACASELPQLATVAPKLGRNVEVVLVSHPQYWTADLVTAQHRQLPFRLATFAPSNPRPLVEHALLQQGGAYAVPKSLVFRKRDRLIVLKREGATEWASVTVLRQIQGLLQ